MDYTWLVFLGCRMDVPVQAWGLPEGSYCFERGVGEEPVLFQQFSLRRHNVFDSLIGVKGYCIVESLSRTH